MTPSQIHLTEDHLDEFLIGCASPQTTAHLQGCAACSARLAEFRSTTAAFNHASEAWSQAKSNTLTRDLHRHRPAFRITARAAWSCASLLVLAAASTLGASLHYRAEQIAAGQVERRWEQPRAASSQEIAGDDAMLRQIDTALDAAEPSPEELYGIADTSAVPRKSSGPQVRD